MPAVTIYVPDSVSEADARLLLALKLYESGRSSSGQAAELAGLSKRAFLELLGKYGVATFNYPPDELARDLANA